MFVDKRNCHNEPESFHSHLDIKLQTGAEDHENTAMDESRDVEISNQDINCQKEPGNIHENEADGSFEVQNKDISIEENPIGHVLGQEEIEHYESQQEQSEDRIEIHSYEYFSNDS